MQRLQIPTITRFTALGVLVLFVYLRHEGVVILPAADPEMAISLVATDTSYRIHVQDAEQQFDRAQIYKNGRLFYRAFSAQPDEQTSTLSRGIVSFVFDDGWVDVYTYAYPVLDQYDIPATIAVIPTYVDEAKGLSSRHLRRLVSSGWDLASHSLIDEPLTRLPEHQQIAYLRESKSYLWANLWAAEFIAYPYGQVDPSVEARARDAYTAGRGYIEGINHPPFDPFDIKILSLDREAPVSRVKGLIDQTESEKGWLVLVGHHVLDHASGEFFAVSQRDLDEIAQYIRQKDLRTVTFGQALQELVPEVSPIRDRELVWEFDKDLLQPGDRIYVAIDGRRSRQIRIPHL